MTAVAAKQPELAPQYNEEDLKADVRRLQDEGVSLKAMSKEAGIPYGSFTNWVGGTYGADTQKIAGQVSNWLASREERAELVSSLPTAPSFVNTPTAQRIHTLHTYAQSVPDIVVIGAGPGTGKTTAAEEFQRTHPNVFIITCHPGVKSAYNLLAEIAIITEVTERLTSRMHRAIGMKLKGRKALLIVDEVQHLSLDALELLRSLHDIWGIGIALQGPPSIYTKIEGKGRDGHLAQLFSRIGGRMTLARPKPEDVSVLAAAWGIMDPKVMRLAQKIAGRPGALRVLTKTLNMASLVASSEGQHALSEAAITTAFHQLGDSLVA